jgi:hypothetical protein
VYVHDLLLLATRQVMEYVVKRFPTLANLKGNAHTIAFLIGYLYLVLLNFHYIKIWACKPWVMHAVHVHAQWHINQKSWN